MVLKTATSGQEGSVHQRREVDRHHERDADPDGEEKRSDSDREAQETALEGSRVREGRLERESACLR